MSHTIQLTTGARYPDLVTDSPASNHWVLTFSCADRPGIVHAVSGAIVAARGNITESQQFASTDTGRFFMRLQVESAAGRDEFEQALAPVVERFGMTHRVDNVGRPLRTLVLVSKAAHCLNDLLFRQRAGQLPVDIPVVLSNHDTLSDLAGFYGVPFESRAVTDAASKAAFEARVLEAVEEHDIELVVLARYMQILSNDLCKQLEGRAINIHHSFLPSFKGARPYVQAHERGVKLVGATAHYVTPDLDEGPIIEQDVIRVNHAQSAESLVTLGRDVEAQVLARAVEWHCQSRVMINGHRTVVFR